MSEALEEAMSYDRLEGVELELSPLGGEGYRHIVADDLEGDLIYHLRDHWVDLPRHDGRARLHRRQVDLPQPGPRSGGEQSEIITYLGELDSHPLEHAGELNEGTSILGCLNQVLCRDKRDTGDLR